MSAKNQHLGKSIKTLSETDFEKVFQKYHQKLYFYFMRQTGSTFLSEELVQLTFIKLWKGFSKEPKDISISSRIFCIARSALIDEFRKQSKEREVLKKVQLEKKNDHSRNAIFEMCLKEDINKAIDSLPPARKNIFQLRRIHGLSLKEIAMKYSISTKTVEDHITKATKHLKTVLKQAHMLGFLFFLWP